MPPKTEDALAQEVLVRHSESTGSPSTTKIQPWKKVKKLAVKEPNWNNACAKRIVTEKIRILDEYDSTR